MDHLRNSAQLWNVWPRGWPPVEGWRKLGKAFKWPFEKDEIYGILNIIERQKAVFSLARQNAHIALSKAIGAGIAPTRDCSANTDLDVTIAI